MAHACTPASCCPFMVYDPARLVSFNGSVPTKVEISYHSCSDSCKIRVVGETFPISTSLRYVSQYTFSERAVDHKLPRGSFRVHQPPGLIERGFLGPLLLLLQAHINDTWKRHLERWHRTDCISTLIQQISVPRASHGDSCRESSHTFRKTDSDTNVSLTRIL